MTKTTDNLETQTSDANTELALRFEQDKTERFSRFCDHHQTRIETLDAQKLEQLKTAITCSDFIFETLLKRSDVVDQIANFDAVFEPDYDEQLANLLADQPDEMEGSKRLRQYRNEMMVKIAWRDINQSWEIEQSLAHLSALANAMIEHAYQWLYALCSQKWGIPTNKDGIKQNMMVIAMGKLGGSELNFSSDIDLIFAYPENGETSGGDKVLSNSQFFTRLGQRLIKVLDQKTVDGFCYRVDMRLRPFGDSGPLVMSLNALEDYYQTHGRSWERYAMVKAQVIGDHQAQFRDLIRPFVYRKYIDYSVIESLRQMKIKINSEVRRRGWDYNIKLGIGGIREIEFIVQFFQLIYGGQEICLRQSNLLATLDKLAKFQHLEHPEINMLKNAYLFLRRLENGLQAQKDKQIQTFPESDLDKTKLAYMVGFENWDALFSSYQAHTKQVHALFEQVIPLEHETIHAQWHEKLWNHADDKNSVSSLLQNYKNLESVEAMASQIQTFKCLVEDSNLSGRALALIDQLMPEVFKVLEGMKNPSLSLTHLLPFIEDNFTRTPYLELLSQHPKVCEQLAKFCQLSTLVADKLHSYPMLLDELIDSEDLYTRMDKADYAKDLRVYLSRIHEDDDEEQMEALRQFKHIGHLKIAALDLRNMLVLNKVSDHLTFLAESLIEAVVNLAWRQLTKKYGIPSHLEGTSSKGFGVIGYGKLGGYELGYLSDLDLVFMHNCPDNIMTDGAKQINGIQFYLRLAQKVLHLFSTRTRSGELYEIDTRLRPSGASGILVVSPNSFLDYQKNSAWTWEHQALIRSRFVCGSDDLRQDFNQTRLQILTQKRDALSLKKDIVNMREKMQFKTYKKGYFHLKNGRGGIVDIEFLTQYWVLMYGHDQHELTNWSDNWRAWEVMSSLGLISQHECEELTRIYMRFRQKVHHNQLQNLRSFVDENLFLEERNFIKAMWQTWLSLDTAKLKD